MTVPTSALLFAERLEKMLGQDLSIEITSPRRAFPGGSARFAVELAEPEDAGFSGFEVTITIVSTYHTPAVALPADDESGEVPF